MHRNIRRVGSLQRAKQESQQLHVMRHTSGILTARKAMKRKETDT